MNTQGRPVSKATASPKKPLLFKRKKQALSSEFQSEATVDELGTELCNPVNKEGVASNKASHKTAAEKAFEEMQRKRLLDKAKGSKEVLKSHKDKIAEFNKKLESLSEHYDIPKLHAIFVGHFKKYLGSQIEIEMVLADELLAKKATELFYRQKEIESRWKTCQDLLWKGNEQAKKALSTTEQVISSYKKVGSVETWLDNVERNLHVISYCLSHKSDEEKA